jgi:hypothetical protein
LAASLAEGALSFVVPRAKNNGLMTCVDIAKPRQWRFDDLVKGAKSGNPTIDAILQRFSIARHRRAFLSARERVSRVVHVSSVLVGLA